MASRRQSSRLKFLAIIACISVISTILTIETKTSIRESVLCLPSKFSIFNYTSIASFCKPVKEMLVKYITDDDSFVATCNTTDLYKLRLQRVGNIDTNVGIRTSTKTECPKTRFQLRPGLPRTALVSYAGAGNTWVRHLLQQMTGLPTGSIYNDVYLRRHGFPFEGKVEDVLAVKTHGINHKKAALYVPVQEFDRVIVLLRDVCDTFTAEFKRFTLMKGHGEDGYIDITDPRWRGYIEPAVYRWERFVHDAFNFTGPILVVFYEDLKTQLLTELIRMAEFLRSGDIREFSFCCAIKAKEGWFHRKSSVIQSDKLFDINFRKLLNDMIHRVANEILVSHPREAKRLLSYTMPL